MSETFTQFLRQKAATYRDKDKSSREQLDEWRGAILRLYDQIREWLKASDPDGILAVKQTEWEVKEPGLGAYRAPRLNLEGLGKWIGIVPKARKTVELAHPPQKSAPQQAAGRVDITDEIRRYVLYRLREDSGDVWLIDDLESGQKPLDQETFEKALMSYLR